MSVAMVMSIEKKMESQVQILAIYFILIPLRIHFSLQLLVNSRVNWDQPV